MKLLVVDDSQVTRKVIKAVAAVFELDVIEAQDGMEAMDRLAEVHDQIDLVLLDWNMPEKNGYDVLCEMKGNSDYKSIPVMMVTAEGQKNNIVAAIRAGAANYLTKPFTVEELETKLIECLQQEGEY